MRTMFTNPSGFALGQAGFNTVGLKQIRLRRLGQGASDKGPSQAKSTGKTADRLCAMLKKFADDGVDQNTASRLFWSYVKSSEEGEVAALASVKAMCPNAVIPPKVEIPAIPDKAESPEKSGFHGKATISFDEAKELKDALDVVLEPLTPEEAANELAKEDCLRQMTDAGGFPIVERLRDRLAEFIAVGNTAETFQISNGELVVTGKAVDCAVALGRAKVVRTALTAGGIAAGGGALLLLLL